MKIIILALLNLVFLFSSAYAKNMENIFYTTGENPETLHQIKIHSKSITIIAPQNYEVNAAGEIHGSISSNLLALAKNSHIKIMPLIMNKNFNKDIFHSFLTHPQAQYKAIQEMVELCSKYNFYGLQFDFENIHYTDKNLLTRFVTLAAKTLHQHGYILSIAVVPHLSNNPDFNAYSHWFFENWSGAYDATKLAQATDFISIMAYDNHTSLTTPGPIAPINWDEGIPRDLLKIIPSDKISLGIPAYSGYWSTGQLRSLLAKPIAERYSFRSKESQIGYVKLSKLLAESGKPLIWDNDTKSYYTMYAKHGLFEYIFVANARSFAAKLNLAQHYHLRGISVWKLGLEDPAIWGTLA